MIRIKWPDGVVAESDTWWDLEEGIRRDQWAVAPLMVFRYRMAVRAFRWSNTVINVIGGSEYFIRELARARMLTIEDDSALDA